MAFGFPARKLILVLAVALGGCGDQRFLTWEPDTPAEKELRLKSERLQQTVGEGAATGIAIGALIGGLLGGGEGAFRGAEIGRLIGAGAGSYVADLQRQYATQEEVLDAVARDIRLTNAELEATIADMKVVLEERRAALQAARAETVSLARQKARAERTLAEMKGAIAAAEQREAFFGEARSLLGAPDATDAGSTELATLKARIAAMRDIATALSQEI
jgi:hypothetical protein